MLTRITFFIFNLVAAATLASASEIFPFGSSWKFFVGTREPSNPTDAWRAINFNDARWTNGITPIGMGKTDIVTRLPASTMNRFWVAAFFRKTFVLTNPASVSELRLTVRIDDGCAVWINGRSLGRYNVPDGDLSIYTPFESPLPLGDIEPTKTTLSLSKDIRSLLVAGTNVIAVEAFNASFFSADFLFDASLEYTVDTTPPKIADLVPGTGVALPSLPQVEVLFDEDVAGVEATDLLINGVAATNLTVVTDAQYIFGFASPPPGPVRMEWIPNHGIHDLAEPANPFAGNSWGYTIDPTVVPPGVVISEFMADNDKTLNDDDGDDSDWIELYNSGFVTADLHDWALTDGRSEWHFPAVSLLPQRYLVVFASGKNRSLAASPLHTSFKLGKDGGYLALLNPQRQVVSEFAPYPVQRTDVSYGRDRGNPDLLGYYPSPTPGTRNSLAGAGFASDVQFSTPSTGFSEPFSLLLTSHGTNAVIHYTLSTNLPTEQSPVYTAPIAIDQSTVVRARAFAPGVLPGPVHTESYIRIAPEVINVSSDLPILVLHNFGQGEVPSSVDQFVVLQAFEPKAGRTSLTNRPDIASMGIFHKRGRSTGGLPKASFSLETQDEFGDDRDVALGGLPSESDWVLYAPNSFDPVLIHNPVAHALMRQMGQYSPRTRFVEVYLQDSANGPGTISAAEYNGVYVLEEKIKISPNRIAIDKLQPEHIKEPQSTGGYLMSIDSAPSGTRPFFGAGASINYLDPDYSEITTPQRDPQEKYITGFFDAFGQALNGPDWTDPAKGYAAYLDVPAAINHHLQGVLTFNVDALRLSGYFYKPRQAKLVMGPVWDFDRTQGSSDGRDFNPRVWRSTVPDYGTDMFNSDPIFDNPWYSKLFRDPNFWQNWIDRYQELRRDVLSLTNVFTVIDTFAGEVRQAQPRDVARWRGSSGSDTSPRSGRRSSGPFAYTFPGTYQGEVDFMKIWYSNRLDFLDHQFVFPPQLDRAGGKFSAGTLVSLTANEGSTIYYTLDGTDPRLPSGAVSPGALAYAGPIRIDANARIVARAQDLAHSNLTGANKPPLSSTWSGRAAATYVVQTPPLVITKIMYDPPASSPTAADGGHFEYVELRNVGSTPLNLAGFRFTHGIDFQFPSLALAAGERVVVVADAASFRNRYGTNALIAGTYSGQLENAGERLALEGPLQEPILDFSYEDDWVPVTRGLGFALVIVNDQAPLSAWSKKSSWRASSTPLGSPGAADPPPPSSPRILVNEITSFTSAPGVDAIELFNADSVEADISGWYLTDDFNTPFKFRVPPRTILPPGAFRVFTDTDFASGATGFRLSSDGDEAYLFAANAATNLIGYVHGHKFGAADLDVSFGRYVTSTGDEDFVAQKSTTLSGTNAGPRVGPIVINEIMSAPLGLAGSVGNARGEFIELLNITDQPVMLGASTTTDASWILRGAVQFSFPPAFILPASGYAVVVGFDPVATPSELTAFREQYQIGADVVILGPWSGQLQNSGEAIRLSKWHSAQDQSLAGQEAEILVDHVKYSDDAPWPTGAKATGLSLQRLVNSSYGNDPINWWAAAPTPGRTNAAPEPDSDHDGLPDSWETSAGLDPQDATGVNGADGDPDGDGFTNLEEYVSGTDPRAAGSHLTIEAITYSGPELKLRFSAAAGRSYSVLARASMGTGAWTKKLTIPAGGSAREVEISLGVPDTEDFPQQFYQVVTPAQP